MPHRHSQGTRTRTLTPGIGLVAALALAASLAGCGPADTGMPRDTARLLQERVLDVSQSAAENDTPGALNTLANLEAEVTAATDGGQLSEKRRRSIMSGVTAVRDELTAAVDAAAADAAEEAAALAAAQTADAAVEAAAPGPSQEYAAPAVAAPAPAPAPGQKAGTGTEKGNEGKGQKQERLSTEQPAPDLSGHPATCPLNTVR